MRRLTATSGALALVAAGLTVMLTPTTAAAAAPATAYTNNGGHAVYYKAATGQFNHVVITDAKGQTEFTIDDEVTITPGTGCAYVDKSDLTKVVCTLTEFGDFWTSVYADLGDKQDSLVIRAGNQNAIHGGTGDDTLVGTGHDIFYGDDGHDTIQGGAQLGGAGHDLLTSPDSGADGGTGHDTLVGSNRADTLRGGPGNDTILGRGGNDILYGNSGNDLIYGGAGNDRISGGPGKDRVYQT